ncbi:hypothetical protein, partial [Lentilactobacillus rapi]|uniref:hypothetical protein n=1 Tax=Lentilactobacillus rapi TaxID=481723 RepID=UPI001CDD4170
SWSFLLNGRDQPFVANFANVRMDSRVAFINTWPTNFQKLQIFSNFGKILGYKNVINIYRAKEVR